jgi:hypothetical protein
MRPLEYFQRFLNEPDWPKTCIAMATIFLSD